jgi:hypothetical protein
VAVVAKVFLIKQPLPKKFLSFSRRNPRLKGLSKMAFLEAVVLQRFAPKGFQNSE